jgi:peptidoglycan/xylan/chitin deacetylase (PgdA/CDA1 family)
MKLLATFYLITYLFIFPVVAQNQNEANIPCFVYHRFGDNRYPTTNISVEDFNNHLQYLSENNFNVITLGNALQLLSTNAEIPHKTVVLTIDDGYKSFLDNGMPLLRKYGYQATLFVNTNASGSDLLNWDEILALKNEGIEIGNHSHAHPYFVNENKGNILSQFREDLLLSQTIFKEKLGYSPELYAYPYGEYTTEMKDELKLFGFVAAAAQNSGVVSQYSDLYALPRFPSSGNYATLSKFIEKANMMALPVETLSKYNPIIEGENPPVLKLKLLKPELINLKSFSCFVGGLQNCTIKYDEENHLITLISNQALKARRTLYTLTAKSNSKTGGWYWYSFLWIISNDK